MAANGQRIHPAGSRSDSPGPHRHAAVPAAPSLDPARERDACGVGFVATASGVRSHEVVGMALEAVSRVAHRGAASTDNSGDGAGLLTQIPARLFYRDAYRLGLHLQPGLPFGVGAFFLPRQPDALGASVRMIEAVLAGDGIPFLGWRDVPVNPAALGPTRARVLSGDPPGAGRTSRPGGGRGRVGARALPGATRDGATSERAEPARVLRLLPLLPHRRLQSPPHRHPALGLLHRLPLPGVRERDRDLPPALLDQHAAELAAGPAVPAAGPQRRDQHALGQPQRDDHAAADAGQPALGREDRAPARRHLARGQRLGQPRQRHGAAGALGPRPGAHAR